MTRQRTAFVFAGGGSLGAVQVGMLQGLVDAGVHADLVVGASVGAINGAYFAGRPDRDGIEHLKSVWLGVRRRDILPVNPARAFLGLFRRSHLVSSSGLRSLIRRNMQARLLEELPVECHVIATDLADGGRVTLSEGSVERAVLASTAIPVLYPPVRHGDQRLIDGGVAANTPIKAAVELGAERVVVLPTGMSCARRRSQVPGNALETALYSLNLMIARQLVADVESLGDEAHITIVPPLCPEDLSLFSFRMTGELIEGGAEQTAEWLQRGGLESKRIPALMQPQTYD